MTRNVLVLNQNVILTQARMHYDAFRNDVMHRFDLLHIQLLRDYIGEEFDTLRHQIGFEFDVARIADDWVLMCFLIGNDYVPHLPLFDVATNGLLWLYTGYKKVLPKIDGKIVRFTDDSTQTWICDSLKFYFAILRIKGYLHEAGKLNRERFLQFLAAMCGVELFAFGQKHQKCEVLSINR